MRETLFSINQFIYLQFCDFVSRVSIYSLDLFRETREYSSIITTYIILSIPTCILLFMNQLSFSIYIFFNFFKFNFLNFNTCLYNFIGREINTFFFYKISSRENLILRTWHACNHLFSRIRLYSAAEQFYWCVWVYIKCDHKLYI